jgi:hypothetical protein
VLKTFIFWRAKSKIPASVAPLYLYKDVYSEAVAPQNYDVLVA